ncbi:MAG: hypothetical protein HKP10_05840 [Kiritimatiellales bacterium]|nr:hypothetical protein [Pontiella sp.]NNJ70794.1 hypothetical protein [Kiritimatiellales bacterium]
MKRIITILFTGSVLVLLCGCDEEKYQLKFSHYIHVTDNEMTCDECHGEPGSASFNTLSHDTCIDCHDEPEAKEITQEACGYCHQENEQQLLLMLMESADETTPAEVKDPVFMHTEALAERCAECHGGLMNEALTSVPRLSRDEVIQIRNEAHVSGEDCLTCHVNMDRYQEPANHDHAWMKRHGQLGMQFDAACSVCHTEDSCTECHSVMQPASHNNLFRRQTHGAVAAWDRASCQTCHEEDSCQSCHSQTRPRSHNARWGAPGFKPAHCIGCHNTSTAGDGCVTCHEGGNDIALHEKYWGGASFNHDILTTESCYICHWSKTP